MANKQRAGTRSCDKVADESEDGSEMLNLLLDVSDDEAPEEVLFEESKAEAQRSLKEALDSVRREKEVLKEKRRRRQQLFQEQKKRRLLTADVLEEIGSSQKQKLSEDEAGEQQQQQQQEQEQGKRRKRKAAQARKLKGNYTVATVTARTLASFQQQAAEDFIHSRLYGPGSCRTTNNELLSLQNKKGTNKSAAVQFVKKDWASKERAKAEKLKKRWLHKQQIDSC